MMHYLLIPFLSLFIISTSFSLHAQQDVPQEQPVMHDNGQENIPVIKDPTFEDEVRKTTQEPDNFQGKFMKMLFILALLIGFMILASMMLKRMTRNRITQMNSQSLIKVLETRYLSPRSTLYLIDIEGKEILIAESHSGVSHIANINSEFREANSENEN